MDEQFMEYGLEWKLNKRKSQERRFQKQIEQLKRDLGQII